MSVSADISARDASEAPVRPGLSIVVPAFNERKHVGSVLEHAAALARRSRACTELIVVDDGSTDRTPDAIRGAVAIVREDGAEFEFTHGELRGRVLAHAQNRGKGAAVRRGMLAARGGRVLMCDADLSAPLEELPKLDRALDEGADVVIGSRDMPDSILAPPQPLGRRIAAWLFRAVRRRLLLHEIRDTQCGFKLFTHEAAQAVFSRCTVNGWLFDCEALAIAAALGLRVREVGIVWRDDPDSRVEVLPAAVTALPTLLAIRRRWGAGREAMG
ncbi:MAG: glycosyltransferase [Phycisphaerae bacterium]|jgi:dolichyl-phosphate beta-glucosyltransferase